MDKRALQIHWEKHKYRNFTDIIEYQNFSRVSQSLNMLEKSAILIHLICCRYRLNLNFITAFV